MIEIITRIDWKLKITGSILLFLFIFSSFSLFFFPQAKNNLSKDESVENSEELKLSATYWTTTEVVSTESTGYSLVPTIALDSAGNAHVAWEDNTDYDGSGIDSDIFYKLWNATTSTWTTTEVVSTESIFHSNHPTIAVESAGNVHVAWRDWTIIGGAGMDLGIFYKRWNVTSSTWTTTEKISTESTGESNDPTIAVDDTGNVHVAWEEYTDYGGSGIDLDIFYKLWNATSSTWTTTEVVSTESTVESNDPTIAVDGAGNVHVAWEDPMNYGGSGIDRDIFYKLWNATSSTWATTEVVSTESTGESLYPTIAVDEAGNAHVAWRDWTIIGGAGIDSDIFYKLWNATTSTWTTTEVVSTESTGESNDPTIAVDDTGNVHVVWEVFTVYGNLGTEQNIFYKLWNTTSSTWTTAEVVSTESTDDPSNPTITVDDAGYAHVAWQDIVIFDSDIFYKRVNKDLNPPTSLVSFIPYRGINEVNISTTFILTADDGLGSGVSVIRYKINNSAWTDYTEPFNLSIFDYGYYLISYQAIDLVNNIETENTLLVRLVELLSEQFIPGYNTFLLIGIICVVSVILFKKLNKHKL